MQTCLNNAEASGEYLVSLHQSITQEVPSHLASLGERETAKVENSLGSIAAMGSQVNAIVDFGIEQVNFC